MNNELPAIPFRDSPTPEVVLEKVRGWAQLPLPVLAGAADPGFPESARQVRTALNSTRSDRTKARLQSMVLEWLLAIIRLNVKRGRIFDLGEVLETGRADCLGYVKLFTVLGRFYGLDCGAVEVIIDNRGQMVPHTIALVRLSGGRKRFLDFWYCSMDIRHRRLGLSVKRGNRWQVEDIDYTAIRVLEDISYLPDHCVDAITLYVEGNRLLKQQDYAGAVEKYTESIRLYPQNARPYYNRALARENLGQTETARADYQRALSDESSLIRTLAVQPEEMVDLIRLDEEKVPELAQHIFLLRQGFITGRKVSPAGIAQKMKLPVQEVKRILGEKETI